MDFELRPLEGVVTGLSGYGGREREFLFTLVAALVGLPQERFAKKDKEKLARGSTHLLCGEAVGYKYMAAIKLSLPLVTRDWLVVCARHGGWFSGRVHYCERVEATAQGKGEDCGRGEDGHGGEEGGVGRVDSGAGAGYDSTTT